ncbi:AsmA-like C-terminal region-containing protein [Flavobacterium terrae]|uniref:AsmA-like C-terminal region n=1 Tax=Flavobacterium terrae TaxID=415425 RepID=A0A1M6DVW2_9FLAO|nr:AsmA-like C-terminal region-containing protein [Flavobacterium terrae]SHI77293.1 AsmA-like C-terminal region [Flavobacterium terrae]
MKKKIFIGIGVFLLVTIVALAAIPIFFKDQIKAKIEQSINENVDAKVTFDDATLSLFKNFPNANMGIEKLVIINKAPFVGDTLVAFEELNLQMSVTELFNGENEPMNLKAISVKNGKANILFNKDGIGNFDIAIKDNKPKEEETKESKPFAMNIQNYEVENFKFKYYDERSKIKLVLSELNHTGKGNFASEVLDLDTKSTTKISLDMDKMTYMKNVAISLDAILGIDLKKSKYTFKDNKAKINELPLEFNGFIQLLESGQDYDLTFKTPTSSFKNFLGLIPAAYASNIETVKTSGDFTVNGKVKGQLTDNTVPKFNIAIASNNASFQYPDLPKSVQNIIIDTKIINETGLIEDTYVNLDKLSFKIDQDVFSAKANIRNAITNALVNASLKGTINLSNFSKAYPVKLDQPLSGILNADVTTKFDMQSVEKSQYQNIQNSGMMTLTGFNYAGPEMAKPVQIQKAAVAFNTSQIKLNQLDMKTGGSDIHVNGTLDNFYGFLFRNQILKGNFNMNSNQFLIADFMEPASASAKKPAEESSSKSGSGSTAKKEAVKIPAFLDCAVSAKANTVVYDNLTLKNVVGKMIIRDQAVTLQDVRTDIFDGQIGFNGVVSTKEKTPKFNMNLNLDKVDIGKSFTQLDMLKAIAPIAGAISGKLNSTIKLNGNLDSVEMTPVLSSLTGDLLGQLLSSSINSNNSEMLTALTSQFKFIDMKKLNLNDIKAAISFDEGKVVVKPFKIKYEDINAEVGGAHGFDQNMKYNIKMDVPAKYLGGDVNKLLSKLTPADQAKIESVPITALMTGNFKSPKISTDMKQATTNLASQIVQMQKDKLLNQGTGALSNILGGKKNTADTTKTTEPKKDAVKNTANQVLEGLFKKKKPAQQTP